VLLVLLVLWIAFLVAVPIWAWSTIDKVNASPAGERPADTPGTTYLLVGSDSRAGLSAEQRKQLATGDAAGQRTDTIMLLHVPDGSGPTLLLSIPRDSYVAIPGHSMDKINAAFSYGGPRLLVATVERATGLRVDDYIEIGFGGFVSIVDAVGGVQICPKMPMKDPRANLDIAKGCQPADGPTALGYVRSRYTDPTGDIGRAARQREVVAAVADKAATPLTAVLPWRYVSLARSGSSAVRIGDDVGPLELAKFAWAVAHVGSSGLTCTVPIGNAGALINGISYVVWNRPAAAKLFNAIAADRTDAVNCSASGA
jgi:LCP family protein required for cell wall assembly